MHAGKQMFLDYLVEIQDHTDTLRDLVEDVPDLGEITPENAEKFFEIQKHLGEISLKLLPLAMAVDAVTSEATRRQAERN